VGKEIRWADLVYLKEAWEDKQSRDSFGKGSESDNQYEGDHAQGYRVSAFENPPFSKLTKCRLSKPRLRRTFDN
jgi:hypothetical protein